MKQVKSTQQARTVPSSHESEEMSTLIGEAEAALDSPPPLDTPERFSLKIIRRHSMDFWASCRDFIARSTATRDLSSDDSATPRPLGDDLVEEVEEIDEAEIDLENKRMWALFFSYMLWWPGVVLPIYHYEVAISDVLHRPLHEHVELGHKDQDLVASTMLADFSVSFLVAARNLWNGGHYFGATIIYCSCFIIPVFSFVCTLCYMKHPKWQTQRVLKYLTKLGKLTFINSIFVTLFMAQVQSAGAYVSALYGFYFDVFSCLTSVFVFLESYYQTVEIIPCNAPSDPRYCLAIYMTFLFTLQLGVTEDFLGCSINKDHLANHGAFLDQFQVLENIILDDVARAGFLSSMIELADHPDAHASWIVYIILLLTIFCPLVEASLLVANSFMHGQKKLRYHPYFLRYISYMEVLILGAIACVDIHGDLSIYKIWLCPGFYWFVAATALLQALRMIC